MKRVRLVGVDRVRQAVAKAVVSRDNFNAVSAVTKTWRTGHGLRKATALSVAATLPNGAGVVAVAASLAEAR